jgi:hypothetical protein
LDVPTISNNGPRRQAPPIRDSRSRCDLLAGRRSHSVEDGPDCPQNARSRSTSECLLRCAVKGKSTQPVQVRPKEVSVRLGSYSGGGTGDQTIEAPRTEARQSDGSASVRAATRVKPEQASKRSPRAPSPPQKDEGRRGRSDAPTDEGRPARRGIGRSTYAHAAICNTGDLSGLPLWRRLRWEAGSTGVGRAHTTDDPG